MEFANLTKEYVYSIIPQISNQILQNYFNYKDLSRYIIIPVYVLSNSQVIIGDYVFNNDDELYIKLSINNSPLLDIISDILENKSNPYAYIVVKNEIIQIPLLDLIELENTREYYNYFDTNDCSICLEKLNEKHSVITSCNHSFHKECLKKLKLNSDKCPLCRTQGSFFGS